jgi:hypothetical protein
MSRHRLQEELDLARRSWARGRFGCRLGFGTGRWWVFICDHAPHATELLLSSWPQFLSIRAALAASLRAWLLALAASLRAWLSALVAASAAADSASAAAILRDSLFARALGVLTSADDDAAPGVGVGLVRDFPRGFFTFADSSGAGSTAGAGSTDGADFPFLLTGSLASPGSSSIRCTGHGRLRRSCSRIRTGRHRDWGWWFLLRLLRCGRWADSRTQLRHRVGTGRRWAGRRRAA